MRPSWTWRGFALVAAAVTLTSCERSVAPPPLGDLSLQVVSGDGQTGTAGAELERPLVVKVTKPNGRPVPNQILNFRVVSGGGSVFAGTALTDSRGIAQERWTLGTDGAQEVEVRAVDNNTGAPLVFAKFTATVTTCRDCWTTLAPMPVRRFDVGVAAANGKIYVIGGDTSFLTPASFVHEYDPAADAWTEKARMPTARSQLGAAEINGIIYAIGGWSGSRVATLEAYDAATDTWTVKAPMPTARRFVGAVALNGLLYAIGGITDDGDDSQAVEVYDPATNSWSSRASLPFSRYGMGLTTIGDTIFLVGGRGGTGEDSSVLLIYDAATDTWSWSPESSLPTDRGMLGAAVVDGIAYAVGGSSPDGAGQNTGFNPETRSWTQKAPLPHPRSHLGVVALDGLVYAVASGSGAEMESPTEAYRP